MDNKKKVLSQKEIIELYKRINNGDIKAKEEVIEKNIKFVGYFAHQFKKQGICIDDLMSIGKIGLIKGVNTYDPSRGVNFSSYVGKCILNEILMELIIVNKYNSKVVSINSPLPTDDNEPASELTLEDIIGTDVDDIYNSFQCTYRREKVKDLLLKLSPRDRELILRRYGFIEGKITTQKELAKILGCSRTNITKREGKVLAKIRRLGETQKLKDLY